MDHLLSMEKDRKEITLWKLGLKNKKLPKRSYLLKDVLLGFERLFLSKILFFEN